MGVWDEYCVICGGPLRNDYIKGEILHDFGDNDEIEIEVDETNHKYDWLGKLYIITSEEHIVSANHSQYDQSGSFDIGNTNYVIARPLWHSAIKYGDGYGYVCHKDCYHFIDNHFRHKLQFGDLCRSEYKYSKYGLMKKYMRQDFRFFTVNRDNPWLIESPLYNNMNASRIISIWTKLISMFKKDPPRPSPCVSATDLKIGTLLPGYDKKRWIVTKVGNTRKWMPVDKRSSKRNSNRSSKRNSKRSSKRNSKKY